MSDPKLKTPITKRPISSLARSGTATKRDSLAAELERDPQMSTAKRQQRTQAYTSHMATSALERQLLNAQLAKQEAEKKLRAKESEVEKLEADRRFLAGREAENEQAMEEERTKYAEEKVQADREIRKLRSTLNALRDEHEALEDEHQKLAASTQQTITAQRAQISTLARQVAHMEQELRDVRALADERSAVVDELQMQMDDLSVAHADQSRDESETMSWGVLRSELTQLAEHNRAVEGQNARMAAELALLRDRKANVEVLKEEKRGLEARLRGMDELREKVVQLEGELDAARRERKEWHGRATQLDSPGQTPVSVSQSLADLRLKYARLLEEHGANVALLRQRDVELATRGSDELKMQALIEEYQERERRSAESIAQLSQSKLLAEREVDFLQKYNASFTAEATVHDVVMDEAQGQRIADLEELVQNYKQRVAELEAEDRRPAAAGPSTPSVKALHDQLLKEQQTVLDARTELKESQTANEKYLESIDKLEQELFELRGEIGGGRHVPPGIRVLSFRDNPAQQWTDLRQEVMDRLKGENEALLRRLHELEEQGVRSSSAEPPADLVPRQSLEVAMKDKTDMEDALKQKEKRLLRLQQVFTAKSAEFRDAIASIMGVKLAFYPNGQVRVTSQYDLNASFVFQPTSRTGDGGGARMQLIAQGEGGPQELPQLMRNWVEMEQCIPCFLASVTLECYDKWKREREREMGIEQ
ncbi:MAD-domain-containing protein [Peniophora sp. CONT]|nr:MAD-domain-containing protein [Peniophora sp. CONT]